MKPKSEKIDKAINSIVKLTDGIKDELDQGTEFPKMELYMVYL